MKKIFLPIAVILVGILFINCPYQSKVPMSQANMNIDRGLLGKWKTSKSKTSKNYFMITATSAKKYKLVENTWSSHKKKFTKKNYTGHLVNFKGVIWLNLYVSRKWVTYKLIKKSAKEYEALPLTGNIQEKFRNSASFKSFIGQHMHLSFFYSYQDKKKFYRSGAAPKIIDKKEEKKKFTAERKRPKTRANCYRAFSNCKRGCRATSEGNRKARSKCYKYCYKDRKACYKSVRR